MTGVSEREVLEHILDGSMKPTDIELSLLKDITNNFSEDLKIGQGGFGTVYKGVLGNRTVAVKRIINCHTFDDKLFYREVNNLIDVDQENVVRFLGFCCNTEETLVPLNGKQVYAERRERLLCFEYIGNGSLDKYITDELRGLEWNIRYRIINGIFEGLHYLHKEKGIIHMDLKPENILIDDHMVPKITDFGLSRLENSQTTSTQRFLTIGYCAPEYQFQGKMSLKSDIYSLGVIILELVTGQKGIPNTNNVLRRWRHRWSISARATPLECKQVTKCIEIGLLCLNDDPFERPSIWDIIEDVQKMEFTSDEKSIVGQMGYKLNDMSTGSKPHHLTLQHLKDITGNFSNERILGIDGFGVVYKGVLPSGEVVAVNKLLQARRISQKQFENEDNLMNLDHPNIVRLVGYCYETQRFLTPHEGKFVIAWNTECLLCLECPPNGSLEKYISDASSGLDWRTRWEIIEGICFGLMYLHEQSNGPIIHMDLKPANILLNENMVPKIADFGLSRLFYKKHIISTATTSGTLGYMPPEYLQGIITPKSDIFSLGVIIMEVVTGHRIYPSDITTSSVGFIELELEKWIKNMLQREPDYASLEMCCQQIKRCIQVGLICVNPERTKRPTMKQIINMLQGLESMNLYITNETSLFSSDELIQLDPPKLPFPYFPNKRVSMLRFFKIVNLTDHIVGFSIRSHEDNSAWYIMEPEKGILPPQSTQAIKVRRTIKENETEIMQCKDKIILSNRIVTEGVKVNDVGKYWKDGDKELPIVLTKPGESSSG